MAEYRLYLLDDRGVIAGRQGFVADSDADADELARAVFNVCRDHCSRYELWNRNRLVVESAKSAPSPSLDVLSARMQAHAVAFEERLRDSHWRISKSRGLLEAIEAAKNDRWGWAAHRSKHRVLVVEDDEPTCAWIARVVRETGFEVLQAGDVLPALTVIQDGNPLSLLITDIRLPSMSGLALGQMARMAHKELKAVYVTAYDLPKDEPTIGPVLRKPIEPHELAITLRTVLAPAR